LSAISATVALACFVARDVWWWVARGRIAGVQTFGDMTVEMARLRSASVALLVVGLSSAVLAGILMWRLQWRGSTPAAASTRWLVGWWVAAGAGAIGFLAVQAFRPLLGARDDDRAFLVAESDRPGAADVAAALSRLESWPLMPLDVLGVGLVAAWWACHLRLLSAAR
jgi:hypothetical protein